MRNILSEGLTVQKAGDKSEFFDWKVNSVGRIPHAWWYQWLKQNVSDPQYVTQFATMWKKASPQFKCAGPS